MGTTSNNFFQRFLFQSSTPDWQSQASSEFGPVLPRKLPWVCWVWKEASSCSHEARCYLYSVLLYITAMNYSQLLQRNDPHDNMFSFYLWILIRVNIGCIEVDLSFQMTKTQASTLGFIIILKVFLLLFRCAVLTLIYRYTSIKTSEKLVSFMTGLRITHLQISWSTCVESCIGMCRQYSLCIVLFREKQLILCLCCPPASLSAYLSLCWVSLFTTSFCVCTCF